LVPHLKNLSSDSCLGRKWIFKNVKKLESEQIFLLRRRRRHPRVAGHRAGVEILTGEDEDHLLAFPEKGRKKRELLSLSLT